MPMRASSTAPTGTPPAVMERLNAQPNRILQDGGIMKTLEAHGMSPSAGARRNPGSG
jgi:hypothetical protein